MGPPQASTFVLGLAAWDNPCAGGRAARRGAHSFGRAGGTLISWPPGSPAMLRRDVVLQGKHVRLEPLRVEHAPELEPVAYEPDMWRYMGYVVDDRKGLETWLAHRVAAMEKGTALAFLQRDARTGKAFGSTSLFDVDLDHRRMEIGHTWVGATHRRTAANTESKLLLLTHAFDALQANRVQLKTDVENKRSQAAIERLGAKKEGILRSFSVYADGSVHDRQLYSIVRAEWPEVRARLRAFLDRPR